ncbi:MAG: ComEC/Rec2 family competence protein [Lachnospirales bacterium]
MKIKYILNELNERQRKILLLIIILAFLLANLLDKKENVPSNDLEVHYINVGQGDSELIIDKDKVLLIDGGENSEEDLMISYLSSKGIEEIDYIIATHPHSDHIGGLDAVINNFSVKNIIMTDDISTTRTYENLLDAINKNNVNIIQATVNNEYTLDTAMFKILGPTKKFDDLNDNSIYIRLIYGNAEFLFTGDGEKAAENELINNNVNISADVLKVGHHGSNTSSSSEFLDLVNPKIAVISCEKNNEYGHPHKEVMERLNKRNIKIYRTDTQGDVIVYTDGEQIEVR